MKTLLVRSVLCVLFICAGVGSLRADDVLRRIQQSLRDQGFYYGPLDGTPGDETTQAIRRYQIRNGLAVTGQLNDETRQAIERTGSTASGGGGTAKTRAPATGSTVESAANATPPPLSRPPAVQVPPPNIRRPTDDDEDAPVAPQPPPRIANNPRPDLRVAPQAPGGYASPQVPNGGMLPSPTLTTLFENTPYEFAPPAVQADILRRAQFALLHSGFYGGQPDGVPGTMTAQALAEFQSANRLRRTARLDGNTLAFLHLLPGRQAPPARRPYDGPPHPRVIFEGRIVE